MQIPALTRREFLVSSGALVASALAGMGGALLTFVQQTDKPCCSRPALSGRPVQHGDRAPWLQQRQCITRSSIVSLPGGITGLHTMQFAGMTSTISFLATGMKPTRHYRKKSCGRRSRLWMC